MKAERFATLILGDVDNDAPPMLADHIVLRPRGQALCGAERPKETVATPVKANCVACYTALDLYRAVLGTEVEL